MSRVVPSEATVTGWRRDGATGIITMPDGSIMCAVDPDRPRPPGINERTSSVAPGGRDWPHPGQVFRTVELEPERPRILQKGEVSALVVVVGTCWAFIFVGGYIEWTHGGLNRCDELCKECGSGSSFGSGSCTECMPGKVCCNRKGSNRRQAPDLTRRGPLSAQLNGGGACYESAADLPPIRTAAGMGGGFYFAIIVGAQVLGALLEVVLILRWAEVGFSNPARTEGDTRAQCVALLAICNHSRVRA